MSHEHSGHTDLAKLNGHVQSPHAEESAAPVENSAGLDGTVDAEDTTMHAQQSIKSAEPDASTVVQSSDPGLSFTFVLSITAQSHHVLSL